MKAGEKLVVKGEQQGLGGMASEERWVAYVGCFTAPGCADPFEGMGGVPHDRSQVGAGVRQVQILSDGKLKEVRGEELKVKNPSYLFLHPREKPHTVFVTSEEAEGKVFAFGIPQTVGEPHRSLGEQFTSGGSPCHLETVGPNDSLLVAPNYGGGSIAVFASGSVGSELQPHRQFIQHGPAGSSVNAARQMEAHAHATISKGNWVFVADLGMDTVVTYAIKDSELSEIHRFAAPAGSGPRSMALHPSLDFLAVTLELSGKILVLRILGSGELELTSEADLYPEDWPAVGGEARVKFNGGKWASDVSWSLDGRFLYVAARLHNSISVFDFPSLSLVQRIPSNGETPRTLCLSPDGALLLVANQHGHNVSSFAVNPSNGHLTLVDSVVMPLAACVKMFRKPPA